MKSLKRTILAIVAVVAMAIPASAQFAFGVKAGLNVNSVSYEDIKSNFDSENRTGWTAGLTTEFTIPVIGLGFDASVMYVHRLNETNNVENLDQSIKDILTNEDYRKQDFIEVPINLKYKLNLPVISKIAVPYVYTGPSFMFLCSKQAATEAFKSRKVDTNWNVGGGVQLLSHLQVGVNYGWGMNKALEIAGATTSTGNDLGKNKTWTITAAYLF